MTSSHKVVGDDFSVSFLTELLAYVNHKLQNNKDFVDNIEHNIIKIPWLKWKKTIQLL